MSSEMLRLRAAGESSLMVYLGETSDPAVNARVHAAVAALEIALADVLIDLVPSYASILVIYNPRFSSEDEPGQIGTYREVVRRIREALQALHVQADSDGCLVTLPTYYSPESGADLEMLASKAGLSIDEVIALHSGRQYRVYAIGFAPGFGYLGDVDPKICAPRLATPRQRVPRGAVAIADQQTAVYPAPSPGGWNLIGCCPTNLFDPTSNPPMPFSVGDRVQFEPVSREDYLALGGELEGESVSIPGRAPQ